MNLVPIAAGIIIGVGNVSWQIGSDFVLSGIAFGSIVAIVGYHVARLLAPKHLREPLDGGRGGRARSVRPNGTVEGGAAIATGTIRDERGDTHPPFREPG